MTLNEALAVKARGLTKEQLIAHLRRSRRTTFAPTFAQSSGPGRKSHQKALAPNRPAIEDRCGTKVPRRILWVISCSRCRTRHHRCADRTRERSGQVSDFTRPVIFCSV